MGMAAVIVDGRVDGGGSVLVPDAQEAEEMEWGDEANSNDAQQTEEHTRGDSGGGTGGGGAGGGGGRNQEDEEDGNSPGILVGSLYS
jgi:hypothetical protein